MERFTGILPAVVTPLDDDFQFRPDVFERLLDRLYGAGVHGVYVGGTTGEGLLQPVAQRKQLTEAAVAGTPSGRHVVVHVGAPTLAETVELARHAAAAGADAVSSLPPAGAYSFEEVQAFYRALGEAAEVPLLLYHFPTLAPAVQTLDQLLELCDGPGVVGLKFTDFDLYTMMELRRAGLEVLNGRDEVLAAGLLMGAGGGIGTFYNVVPEAFVELFACAQTGDWERARAVQSDVNALIRATLRFPVFAAVKAMLGWSGLDCGPMLPPRRALTADEDSRLRQAVLQTPLGAVLADGGGLAHPPNRYA